jgi:hypothetical protein
MRPSSDGSRTDVRAWYPSPSSTVLIVGGWCFANSQVFRVRECDEEKLTLARSARHGRPEGRMRTPAVMQDRAARRYALLLTRSMRCRASTRLGGPTARCRRWHGADYRLTPENHDVPYRRDQKVPRGLPRIDLDRARVRALTGTVDRRHPVPVAPPALCVPVAERLRVGRQRSNALV